MNISKDKSLSLALLIIFISTSCYAPVDTPSLNDQMSTFNKRVHFYLKCLRRKCTIEERNAALKVALIDGTILAALITGVGFVTKYGLRPRQAPARILPIQTILTDIQNQEYPIKIELDEESLQINHYETINENILDITAVSDTSSYKGISSNLNNLLEQIFKLANPQFNAIIIQLLGKDDALAYRFDFKNNKWEEVSRGIRKKGESKYRSLPLT